MKIAVYDDAAYWVDENTFWTCPVEAGVVKKSLATPVDTTSMSDKDMSVMFDILDALE